MPGTKRHYSAVQSDTSSNSKGSTRKSRKAADAVGRTAVDGNRRGLAPNDAHGGICNDKGVHGDALCDDASKHNTSDWEYDESVEEDNLFDLPIRRISLPNPQGTPRPSGTASSKNAAQNRSNGRLSSHNAPRFTHSVNSNTFSRSKVAAGVARRPGSEYKPRRVTHHQGRAVHEETNRGIPL